MAWRHATLVLRLLWLSVSAVFNANVTLVGLMKWIDDLKDSASAFKEWGRILTIIGIVIASSLVAIVVELFVICIKM